MMIVESADAFLEVMSRQPFPALHAATARAAFLVSPLDLTLALESCSDNCYMQVHDQVDPDLALRSAPEQGSGHFKVPKVIER